MKEADGAKYVLQKKLRFAEESTEQEKKKAEEEVSSLKQQVSSLRLSHTASQKALDGLRRLVCRSSCFTFLLKREQHVERRSVSAEWAVDVGGGWVPTRRGRAARASRPEGGGGARAQAGTQPGPRSAAGPGRAQSTSARRRQGELAGRPRLLQELDLLSECQQLERENSQLRSKLRDLQHAHDTLLELHGESTIRLQELEQENAEIRNLCREQTLLLAGPTGEA